MSTHTITGYLYHVTNPYDDSFDVIFNESALMPQVSPAWTLIREQSFEVEVPDDFDPRPQQIAALEEEKRRIRAEFAAKVAEIDERIQSLLAIEMAS